MSCLAILIVLELRHLKLDLIDWNNSSIYCHNVRTSIPYWSSLIIAFAPCQLRVEILRSQMVQNTSDSDYEVNQQNVQENHQYSCDDGVQRQVQRFAAMPESPAGAAAAANTNAKMMCESLAIS